MADLIQQELQRIGNQIVAEMRNTLARNGSNASGTLSDSIQATALPPQDNVYTLDIAMEDYGPIVDGGRGQSRSGGKKQTWRRNIESWIRLKGISLKPGVTLEQAAFLITRKINEKGYRAKPFIQPSVDSVLNKNQQPLTDVVSRVLVNKIDQILK
jgi:hypothetical protein